MLRIGSYGIVGDAIVAVLKNGMCVDRRQWPGRRRGRPNRLPQSAWTAPGHAGYRCCVTGPVVCASSRASADPNQLAKHAHAVAQQTHLRCAAIVPLDRDFDDAQTSRPRDAQHLDVERPSVDLHQRKDRFDGGGREHLEPALSIFDARHRQALNREIEHPSRQVPNQRLADATRAEPFAAADGDVEVLEPAAGETAAARDTGMERSASQMKRNAARAASSPALTAPPLPRCGSRCRTMLPIPAGMLFDDAARSIGRAIVYDPDFPVPRLPSKERAQIDQRLTEPRLFVERRNDDRDAGAGGRHRDYWPLRGPGAGAHDGIRTRHQQEHFAQRAAPARLQRLAPAHPELAVLGVADHDRALPPWREQTPRRASARPPVLPPSRPPSAGSRSTSGETSARRRSRRSPEPSCPPRARSTARAARHSLVDAHRMMLLRELARVSSGTRSMRQHCNQQDRRQQRAGRQHVRAPPSVARTSAITSGRSTLELRNTVTLTTSTSMRPSTSVTAAVNAAIERQREQRVDDTGRPGARRRSTADAPPSIARSTCGSRRGQQPRRAVPRRQRQRRQERIQVVVQLGRADRDQRDRNRKPVDDEQLVQRRLADGVHEQQHEAAGDRQPGRAAVAQLAEHRHVVEVPRVHVDRVERRGEPRVDVLAEHDAEEPRRPRFRYW